MVPSFPAHAWFVFQLGGLHHRPANLNGKFFFSAREAERNARVIAKVNFSKVVKNMRRSIYSLILTVCESQTIILMIFYRCHRWFGSFKIVSVGRRLRSVLPGLGQARSSVELPDFAATDVTNLATANEPQLICP